MANRLVKRTRNDVGLHTRQQFGRVLQRHRRGTGQRVLDQRLRGAVNFILIQLQKFQPVAVAHGQVRHFARQAFLGDECVHPLARNRPIRQHRGTAIRVVSLKPGKLRAFRL